RRDLDRLHRIARFLDALLVLPAHALLHQECHRYTDEGNSQKKRREILSLEQVRGVSSTRPMHQKSIGKHKGAHRFYNRDSTYRNARVVTRSCGKVKLCSLPF